MDKYIISLSMPSINHQIYIHTHKHTYIYIYITVTKSPCFVYESWEIFKKVLTKSKLDLVFGFIRKKYVLIGNIKKKKRKGGGEMIITWLRNNYELTSISFSTFIPSLTFPQEFSFTCIYRIQRKEHEKIKINWM